MKRDFNKLLETLGPAAPVKTLTELREWNITHIDGNAIRFGQSNLDISDEVDLQADRAKYEADRAKDLDLAATHGIDEAMKSNHLDALLFPGARGFDHCEAWISHGFSAVRHDTQRADAAVPGRLRCETGAAWNCVFRHGLQ